jgi:kynureninase
MSRRSHCQELDSLDLLASSRSKFELDDEQIYLGGASVGPMARMVGSQLGDALVTSWNQRLGRKAEGADRHEIPRRIGEMIAQLIGGSPGEVTLANDYQVNLFHVLDVALGLKKTGHILTEGGSTPGRWQVAHAGCRVKTVERHGIREAIDQRVAAVLLAHVDEKSGHMHEMEQVNRAANGVGAFTVWDLSQSAGVVPINLSSAGADFAAGSMVGYLCGGPSSSGYSFVSNARRPRRELRTLGMSDPREWISVGYGVMEAIDGSQSPFVTASLFGLASVEIALRTWVAIDMIQVRAKSIALTDLFLECFAERCAGLGFTVLSPVNAAQRGAHVSLTHVNAPEIAEALATRRVIVDRFSAGAIRFALSPLYTRFVDVWDAVECLAEVAAPFRPRHGIG